MSVPMMFNLNLPGRYWVENYPITSARLPNLSYDEVVTEAVVDDFGNVITQKLVKGIRVTVDADFATHGDRVEFVASLTRKPIAAKANFQAYVQCLGNELSK
jgi:predicted kinase